MVSTKKASSRKTTSLVLSTFSPYPISSLNREPFCSSPHLQPFKNEILPHGTNPQSEPCQFFPVYPWIIVLSPSPHPGRAGKGRDIELETCSQSNSLHLWIAAIFDIQCSVRLIPPWILHFCKCCSKSLYFSNTPIMVLIHIAFSIDQAPEPCCQPTDPTLG